MKETFVPASSNLSEVSYDSDAKTLEITFKEGRTWRYENVPVTVFQGLQHARSAGSYFYRNVRGVYNEAEI